MPDHVYNPHANVLEAKVAHDTDSIYVYIRTKGEIARTTRANGTVGAGRYYVIATIDVDMREETGYRTCGTRGPEMCQGGTDENGPDRRGLGAGGREKARAGAGGWGGKQARPGSTMRHWREKAGAGGRHCMAAAQLSDRARSAHHPTYHPNHPTSHPTSCALFCTPTQRSSKEAITQARMAMT